MTDHHFGWGDVSQVLQSLLIVQTTLKVAQINQGRQIFSPFS
jgi:hypothetical protein